MKIEKARGVIDYRVRQTRGKSRNSYTAEIMEKLLGCGTAMGILADETYIRSLQLSVKTTREHGDGVASR